jgi:hypothetical protein
MWGPVASCDLGPGGGISDYYGFSEEGGRWIAEVLRGTGLYGCHTDDTFEERGG